MPARWGRRAGGRGAAGIESPGGHSRKASRRCVRPAQHRRVRGRHGAEILASLPRLRRSPTWPSSTRRSAARWELGQQVADLPRAALAMTMASVTSPVALRQVRDVPHVAGLGRLRHIFHPLAPGCAGERRAHSARRRQDRWAAGCCSRRRWPGRATWRPGPSLPRCAVQPGSRTSRFNRAYCCATACVNSSLSAARSGASSSAQRRCVARHICRTRGRPCSFPTGAPDRRPAAAAGRQRPPRGPAAGRDR